MSMKQMELSRKVNIRFVYDDRDLPFISIDDLMEWAIVRDYESLTRNEVLRALSSMRNECFCQMSLERGETA